MLNRRDFLRRTGQTAALAVTWPFLGLAPAAAKSPPNIVLIFTDDQGYADLGNFGAKGFQTPNIDRMAQEGTRFTDFHVGTAVCSASRAALMTGCYHKRVSIFRALFPYHEIGLNPDEQTIADVLRARGYTNGIFGKWHLGHHVEFLPLQQGFHEYVGLPYSNDMWPVHYDGKPISLSHEGSPSWKVDCPPLPLIHNNTIVDYIRTLEDQAKLVPMLTDHAVDFIERNAKKPFFLYLPFPHPHVPLAVTDDFRGKCEQGMYGDVIQRIDHAVGRILDTIKQQNLDENTLVIFTSDNGPWLSYGNHGGCADPLREAKGAMWEGGCRVPCVMRWPGTIPAGRTCDKLASTIDLLPTFAALADAPLPEKKIDGVDISDLMKGVPNANPRNEFCYYWSRGLVAVRRGKWKLVFPHRYISYEGIPRGQDGWPEPATQRETPLALYDLENDVSETTNVIDEHPDVVAELEALAERVRADLGDELTQQAGSGVRPAGHI